MKKKNATPSNSHRFLWLITGLLIGIFACCLTFLKKQVVIVENSQQQPQSIAITSQTPAHEVAKKHKEKAASSKSTNGNDGGGDQYDFYTMLPQMQVKQAAPATTPATPAAPAPKPTKPLAAAEQSMLAPQQIAQAQTSTKTNPQPAVQAAPSVPATTTPAPASATATAATPTNITTPAASKTNETTTPSATAAKPVVKSSFTVVAGDFNDYDKADSRKAELFLAGLDKAKIEKYTKNGATWYRVTVGTYSSQAKAKLALQQLQAAQFTGTIQVTP